ncbi:MAG: hypothetical protein ACRDTC_06420 [Pseudonocardiaceae bacterium]
MRFVVSPEKVFDDAVTGGDWVAAATVLAKPAMPMTRLAPLTIDQLRLLQDGVTRGGVGSVPQTAIAAELQRRGVPVAKVAAGAAFGTIETTLDEQIDGDAARGTWYSYKISIAFTPDTAVVHADEIAFIQTVRLVETASGANRNPDERSRKRQTPSATNVDRRGGKRHGWYGMKDDGMPGTMLVAWKTSAPARPARMQDRASWNEPHTTWQFEAMVVCRSGLDVGTVYGAVTWGFSVDADLKLTERAPTVTNKQSTEATAAVGKWNEQTAGSPFDRNAQNQLSLPALR